MRVSSYGFSGDNIVCRVYGVCSVYVSWLTYSHHLTNLTYSTKQINNRKNNNEKIIAVLILTCSPVFSANEYLRSKATGNWDALTTWEMSVNNTVWTPAALTPNSTSNLITIRNSHTVTVTENVIADHLTVDTGGTMSVNDGVIFTLLNGAGTDLTVFISGTVSGSGTFQTQGSVLMNLRDGSAFQAALKVNTGTAMVSDLTTPFEGKLYGPVTIDAGATLSSNTSSSYTLYYLREFN